MFKHFNKTKNSEEIIADQFFNKLSFIRANEHESSNLFGARYFQPLNCEIEYQLNNDEKTVTQEQKEWIIAIENNYDLLKIEMENFINDEFAKMYNKAKKYSLEKDLTIELITIPKLFVPGVEWSLTYRVKEDFLFLTIEFLGWKLNSLYISA